METVVRQYTQKVLAGNLLEREREDVSKIDFRYPGTKFRHI